MTDLLSAFLGPGRRALVDMVPTTKAGYLPTGIQRRRLSTGFTGAFPEHRGALGLLNNEESARVNVGLGDRRPILQGRLVKAATQ